MALKLSGIFIFLFLLTTNIDKDNICFLIEDCANAIDDDGDGLIDLNDPDCDCPVLEPVSLIPNPSFEEMNCCPQNRSELHCADTWIQASEPTTDYIHLCGFGGWSNFPPPMPYPDGEGIIGFRDGRYIQGNPELNWKEYAGACLLSPLMEATSYRFEFFVGFVDPISSPPIDITFFGTPDCQYLPFGAGDEAFGCPTNGPNWVELGSTRVSGNGWIKTSLTVTPDRDINAIAIGPDCPHTTANVSTYYFFDNLVLAEELAFDFVVTEINHPCNNDFSLKLPSVSGVSYQWYRDGIALVGETGYQLSENYGEGDYQVLITRNGECKVTSIYTYDIPVLETFIVDNICDFEIYTLGGQVLNTSGSYQETFTSKDGCDSIVTLELKVLGKEYDSINVLIHPSEQYIIGSNVLQAEGNYDITLASSLGCDSLVHVQLQHYDYYFPNVFTPNDDGINDFFNLFGQVELVNLQQLIVYNRWGEIVYREKDIPLGDGAGWDGRYDTKLVESGVYVYAALVQLNSGEERWITGNVTVLK